MNDGEKVERDAVEHPLRAHNSAWDGKVVRISGARNEIVAVQIIVEADGRGIHALSLRLPSLVSPAGRIVYKAPAETPTVATRLADPDHVGIDDQPFYYGGMLNVFKMRSNLVRMALTGGTSLADGESAFSKVHAALRARGGGTISIYYHPNEWVQTEFWDAVNFSHGANPPPR